MGTEIQDEIVRVNANVAATYAALADAGADMPDDQNSDNLAETAGRITAVLYGKAQNLTESQKARARQNIGAAENALRIPLTFVAETDGMLAYSHNSSLAEIAAAYNAGQLVQVELPADGNTLVLPLVTFVDGNASFCVFEGSMVYAAFVSDGAAVMMMQDVLMPEDLAGHNSDPDAHADIRQMIADLDLGDKVTAESITGALDYTPANVEDVFESALQPTFTNVFDTVSIEFGKMINSDGTLSDTTAALATTDYIPIKTGDVIRMADFALYYTGSVRIAVYNSSKNFVTSVTASALIDGAYYLNAPVKDADGNVLGFTVSKPSTGFIRICTNTAVIGSNPVLTINEEIAYEVGYGTMLNPMVKVPYSQIIDAPQKNGWSILPNEHLNICYSSINRKPINTVEHFTDAATNFGYNALKCDVRPTSDGELVCCHDAGFTFDSNGYITTYNASNSTVIHDVTAATVLGYSFKSGEHPCLVGDYLDVCRKYGKVAFITIRNEYMDVVIPKLLDELRIHNMTHSAIINCMTYESLVQWREVDKTVMINYTLNFGVAIDQTQIDRAVGLGYCSLCGFSLSSSAVNPSASCDFEYARANGIRLLEAIAYKEGSPEACYDLGYDGCQIGIPWNPITPGGITEEEVDAKIAAAISGAIGGSY